jgi:hypothetical protein
VLKISFFDIEFHFFSSNAFFKLTLRFGVFFTMNPMRYGTPCTQSVIFPNHKSHKSHILFQFYFNFMLFYFILFYFMIIYLFQLSVLARAGVDWLGLTRAGSGWRGLAWVGQAWTGLVWLGLAWSGLVWLGLAWSGLVWLGLAWAGLGWHGLAWAGLG